MQMPPDPPPPKERLEVEPISRKRSLKMYSKGELIRYAMELEERIERALRYSDE